MPADTPETAAAGTPASAAPPGRLALYGASLAAAVIMLDQLVKAWALYIYQLPARGHVDLSPVMDLTMVWNRGVSFGLLHSDSELGRWLLTIFPLVVVGFLGWWLSRVQRPLLAAAIGLVIGGAIGNAIDRVAYGAVADFLDFSDIFFPWVFNIADASISVGVGLLLLDSVLDSLQARKGGAR
jgi:signal peptidase II